MPSFPAPPRCGRHFSTLAAVPALDSRGHQPGVELARTATLKWLVVASVAALGVLRPGLSLLRGWSRMPRCPRRQTVSSARCRVRQTAGVRRSVATRTGRIVCVLFLRSLTAIAGTVRPRRTCLISRRRRMRLRVRSERCRVRRLSRALPLGRPATTQGLRVFRVSPRDGTVACGQRCPHRRSMSTTLCRACPRACASPSGREQRIGTGYGGPRTGCRIPVG